VQFHGLPVLTEREKRICFGAKAEPAASRVVHVFGDEDRSFRQIQRFMHVDPDPMADGLSQLLHHFRPPQVAAVALDE
jgi:hypothetical protein